MVLQKPGTSINLIKAEIPIIQQIIRDETWYEGERRGCYVPSDDDVVMKRVCKIIQKCDKLIRQQALKKMKLFKP